jgi:uncharacterized membrane protein
MGRTDDLARPSGTPGGPSYDPDAFARMAERMARFLGTGRYLAFQTILVFVWIVLNVTAASLRWDPYPFILLNLLFSTQAAYAAPLILLAQTRQTERDKASAEADAHHREDVATRQRQLIEENTGLTRDVKRNTDLLEELHRHVTAIGDHLGVSAGEMDPEAGT